MQNTRLFNKSLLRAHRREFLKEMNRRINTMLAASPDNLNTVLRHEIDVIYAILYQTPLAADRGIQELLIDRIRVVAHQFNFDDEWVKERVAFATMQGTIIRLLDLHGGLHHLNQ